MTKKRTSGKRTTKRGASRPTKAPGRAIAVAPVPASEQDEGAVRTEEADEFIVDAHLLPRDPRMPGPGTLLQKRDRHGAVRCECTVEEGGIRYRDKLYRSLSAAAMAAASDLGLNHKTQNGFSFWQLTKSPRLRRDPLATLAPAWERYHRNLQAVVDDVTDEDRSKVAATIARHALTIGSLHERVDSGVEHLPEIDS